MYALRSRGHGDVLDNLDAMDGIFALQTFLNAAPIPGPERAQISGCGSRANP
jgi:hypothetical protein